MTATLTLTSPETRGEQVVRAQRRLDGDNVFRGDWLQSPVDGVFGLATSRACKRAKYWLGYTTARQTGSYGAELAAYLSGSKPLPLLYRQRRRARLAAKAKAAASRTLGQRAVAVVRPKLGTVEVPAGSNRVFASLWYGMIGPWCAMLTTFGYAKAGSTELRAGVRYAYVPFIVTDARAGRHGLSTTRNPVEGDLVCFDWQGRGLTDDRDSPYNYDHVGYFIRWVDRLGGTFATIEGNTSAGSSGSQSNGGGLFERTRSLRDARVQFVHPAR